MGLFDIFSRKKVEEPDLRHEFDALKMDFAKMQQQINTINSDITVLCENVSVIAQKNDNGRTKHELTALHVKMKELLTFAKLSLQNHDELDEIKRRISTIPANSVVNTVATPKEQNNFGGLTDMTTREREIISILLNSEIPLSNIEIGSRLGISPVTAKGHINAIKKRHVGIVIDVLRGKNKKDYTLNQEFRMKILGV